MSNTATRRKQPKKQVQPAQEPAYILKENAGTSSNYLGRFIKVLMALGTLTVAVYLYYTYLLFEIPESADSETNGYPFKVVEIPEKGKGAVASRDISQGELVLREAPLFRVPSEVITYSPGALLLASIAGLTAAQRAVYYNLSYINMPSHLTPGSEEYNDALALAIFQTNAVATGDSTGMFPRMARLNHGCSSAFNSVYTWRENEGALVVHAIKPIKMGEELLTTYLDTKKPKNERRSFLHDHYGFDCNCSVCSLPETASIESDRRLSKMAELYGRFSTWGSGHLTGKQAIDIAREIWTVGEEEGYWSERGQLAADAALVAAAHYDKDAVRAWAELAKEWYTYELGADSEQVQTMRGVLANPTSHQMWGARGKEDVGRPGLFLQL